MDDLFDIANMGRFGGVVAVGLGVALTGVTIYMLQAQGRLWIWGVIGGPLLLVVGIAGFVQGVQKARLGKPQASLEGFRTDLEHREVGFWACTRCRVTMPVNYSGECLECGSGVDCYEVANEDDRKIALAALGS